MLVSFISYAFGNLSFARYISRLKKNDITRLGSGNPGSTNMLRNFGFKIGVLNLILDMLKGFVPTLITYFIFKSEVMSCELNILSKNFFYLFGEPFAKRLA